VDALAARRPAAAAAAAGHRPRPLSSPAPAGGDDTPTLFPGSPWRPVAAGQAGEHDVWRLSAGDSAGGGGGAGRVGGGGGGWMSPLPAAAGAGSRSPEVRLGVRAWAPLAASAVTSEPGQGPVAAPRVTDVRTAWM
jgi:hypothetical protein